ncbi:MFS transporter [Paludibacterium paludis]|uniref:MFS transporter n=1 Tax=Paludibacterium paludis TaxID=1225769 RepID=A0A918UAJ2_9NEIS|nr:MFS transporter [Paludibacterium paludis]GGY17660.1 MFS transporter [Paludibacterium paludis]
MAYGVMGDHSPSDTFSDPSGARGEWAARVLGYASLGGALEFYNFIIFVFFAREIGQLFFPVGIPPWLRDLQVYGLFAAGYLARPLGGLVMAHFGDRRGRKGVFILSLLLMAAPTLAIGLLPTYAQIGASAPLALLALRLVQGVAVGGEVPGGWIFVAEHVPAWRRGFACGVMSAALALGILVASLITTLIGSAFDRAEVLDGVWRVPFLLGGVFGLLAVLLRRRLVETPVFLDLSGSLATENGLPLGKALTLGKRASAESMVLTWLLASFILTVILILPGALQERFAAEPASALLGNSLAILCLIAGSMCAGMVADRHGTDVALLGGAACLGACQLWLFASLAPGEHLFFLPYALTGFFVGVTGAVPSAMVERFPAAFRYSGISLAYNVAYAICAVATPLIVTALFDIGRMAVSAYLALVCLAVVWLSARRWRRKGRSTPKPAVS